MTKSLYIVLLMLCCGQLYAAAVTIVPGIGFGLLDESSPEFVNLTEEEKAVERFALTPVAPVGGNLGTTIGQQRLFAAQRAATLWGSSLESEVEILVKLDFTALPCTPTSVALGAASPGTYVFFTTPRPGLQANTFYPIALARKITATRVFPETFDVRASFSAVVGTPACSFPSRWYYGYDNSPAGTRSFLVVFLHELGHGLGMAPGVTLTTGRFLISGGGQPYPTIYAKFIRDNSLGLTWDQMTDEQRVASATNYHNVVWDGAQATATVPAQMLRGVTVNSPDSGTTIIGRPARFGPQIGYPAVKGEVFYYEDDTCVPYTGRDFARRIVSVSRGSCLFTTQVRNAQAAGAIGVIVRNTGSQPIVVMDGQDPEIKIPSLMIQQVSAAILGNTVTLGFLGTDEAGKVLLYAPTTVSPGSSIGHWDRAASPDLLMEPFTTTGQSASLDLTLRAFADMGWYGEGRGVKRVSYEQGADVSRIFTASSGLFDPQDLGRGILASWAPHGQRLTYTDTVTDTDGVSRLAVFVANADGAQRRLIGPANSWQPKWSPDGNHIAFLAHGDDGSKSDLYIMRPDGGNVRRLTQWDSLKAYPTWSPDSRYIAFSSSSDNSGKSGLWIVDIDHVHLQQLTVTPEPFSDSAPSWSADGTRIAFVSNRDNAEQPFTKPARPRIWLINLHGPEIYPLPGEDHADDSILSETDPAWTESGDLFFVREAGERSGIYFWRAGSPARLFIAGTELRNPNAISLP